MACYPVQCLVPPCPEICDGKVVTSSPQTVSGPYVNTTLPSRNIDTRLLMFPAPTVRQPGTYTGGQYPSSSNPVPDFTTEVVELDWWRMVALAIGFVVAVVIIKRA